jgi:hypothetical protein
MDKDQSCLGRAIRLQHGLVELSVPYINMSSHRPCLRVQLVPVGQRVRSFFGRHYRCM